MTTPPVDLLPPDDRELLGLFGAVRDETATPEQFQRLESLLRADDRLATLFVRLMRVHALLERNFEIFASCDADSCVNDRPSPSTRLGVVDDEDEPRFLVQDAGEAVGEPVTLPPIIIQSFPMPRSPFSAFVGSGLFSYLAAALIIGIGLMAAAVWKLSDRPQIATQGSPSVPLPSPLSRHPSVVARVTGMVDCVWEGTGGREQGTGDRGQNSSGHSSLSTTHYPPSTVSVGDVLALKSGLLELTYDTGARVILEGPVTYTVDSAVGGYLAVGRLTAKLEKRGEERGERGESVAIDPSSSSRRSLSTLHSPLSTSSNPQSLIPNPSLSPVPCPLFSIKTPTAVVTDLGTEFGVDVTKEGVTTSHVFRGSVELRTISLDETTASITRVLHANESAQVDCKRMIRAALPALASDFVRDISKRTIKMLDLVDVVAGGNGFTGRRNRGINPTNGQPAEIPPTTKKQFYLTGDKKYHRVAAMPLVDGVFIPTSEERSMQVDSAGHAFADWLHTSTNQTYGYIWAGGKIPSDPDASLRTELSGVDYATTGRGLVFLHANSGITFDLAAIRKANPGYSIARFHAVTGNTNQGNNNASAYVLVDGQQRFRRRDINGFSGEFVVDIPISDADGFLTLASTDNKDGIACDWIIFGDPQLELKTTNRLP